MKRIAILEGRGTALTLPILPAALLAVAFFQFQRGFQLSHFRAASLAVLMDGWVSSGQWALGEAARIHWLTSLFVASALLLAVLVSSLIVIGPAWWMWLTASVPLGIVVSAGRHALIPRLQREELELAREAGTPDALPYLMVYLVCTVVTIVLVVVAVAHTLDRVAKTDEEFRRALAQRHQGAVAGATFETQHHSRLEALHSARDTLRALLSVTTAWLVSGVIGISLLHRWPATTLPEQVSEVLKPIGVASTVFTGAFYSCLLCAIFLPSELYVRLAAQELATTRSGPGAPRSAVRTWLTEEGFDLSTPAALTRLSAVFAPLAASVLQGIAKL